MVGYPICEWTDNTYMVECVEEDERLSGIVIYNQFADGAAGLLRSQLAVEAFLGSDSARSVPTIG